MKKIVALTLLCCLFFSSCGNAPQGIGSETQNTVTNTTGSSALETDWDEEEYYAYEK